MRLFYNLLIYLAQIPAAGYFFCRAFINKDYKSGNGQRFGLGYPKLEKCVWLHAVSVGEVQAASVRRIDMTARGLGE